MSIWQTETWQRMLVESAQVQQFFCIEDIFVEKRSIGFKQYGLFVLGGEPEKIPHVWDALKALCKSESCLFVQYETFDIHQESSSYLGKNINVGYYKKFITPYSAIIDLTKTQSEILSGMKPKGRYNIRLAQKKGVTIKAVEVNKSNIDIFYKLMSQTTQAKLFKGNQSLYYKVFLENLPQSKLLFAFFEDRVIAAGIFVFTKNIGIYYYGASVQDREYKKVMAPYLLQWEAIKIAQANGCIYYDFLGVADPHDTQSSLFGVTDFKKKFTSDIRKVSESYIWINKKFWYTVITFLKKIKRAF